MQQFGLCRVLLATSFGLLASCAPSGQLNSDLVSPEQRPVNRSAVIPLSEAAFYEHRDKRYDLSFSKFFSTKVHLKNGATLNGILDVLEQVNLSLSGQDAFLNVMYTGPDLLNVELLTALEVFSSETGVDFIYQGNGQLKAEPLVTKSIPVSGDVFKSYTQSQILSFIQNISLRKVGDISATVSIASFNSTNERVAIRAPSSVFEAVREMLTLTAIQPKFPAAKIVKGTFKENIERLAGVYGFSPVIWEDHIKDCIWMQDTEYEIPYVDPMDVIAFYANATGFKAVFSNIDSHVQMVYTGSVGKVRDCEK